MKIRLPTVPLSSFFALADASAGALPPDDGSKESLGALRALAERGAFYLDAEDPRAFKVELRVEEGAADLPPYCFERQGGSFLLAVPSGKIATTGGASVEVEPGDYAASVWVLGLYDNAAYDEARRNLLGAETFRRYQRAGNIALVGCFPIPIAAIVALFAGLSWITFWAFAVAILAFLPTLFLTRTRWYREADQRLDAQQEELPYFVIELRRIADRTGLSGGRLMV